MPSDCSLKVSQYIAVCLGHFALMFSARHKQIKHLILHISSMRHFASKFLLVLIVFHLLSLRL